MKVAVDNSKRSRITEDWKIKDSCLKVMRASSKGGGGGAAKVVIGNVSKWR